MNEIKLEANDLFKVFEYIGQIRSSNDTMEHLSTSPIHILIHNAILKYSKEELEECRHPRWKSDLFEEALSKENPFFFSALINAGAFHEKLTDHSRWLLSVESQPSNALFELIYRLERSKYSRRNATSEEALTTTQFLNIMLGTYLYKLDTSEKIKMLDKCVDDFGKKNINDLMKFIVDGYHEHSVETFEYLALKLKNKNVDFSQNDFLNKYLPDENKNSPFKHSWQITKIKKLLEMGYRFDEQEYSHNGDNLFITICKNGDMDAIKTILPYLKDINPKDGDWEAQQEYINNLTNTHPTTFKFIQTMYGKCLLENQLPNQDSYDKKKIKI